MAKKVITWSGWLIDNPLTEDPNDFTLKVKAGSSLLKQARTARFEKVLNVSEAEQSS